MGLEQTLTRGDPQHGPLLPNFSVDWMRANPRPTLPLIGTPGPLLNRCGEVVGLTLPSVADAKNIGCIPINHREAVVAATPYSRAGLIRSLLIVSVGKVVIGEGTRPAHSCLV